MRLATFAALAAASFTLSVVLCGMIRRFAERRHLVDTPNDRSLHQVPTPRFGGVAIVSATIVIGGAGVAYAPALFHRDLVIWAICAAAIALLGLRDDVRSMRASVRMLVQLVVSASCAILIVGPELALTAGWSIAVRAPVVVASCVYVVAVTNIYNFMDGMDGIAATQGIGAAVTLAFVSVVSGNLDVAIIAVVIAGATCGFLAHNAPPATLFMGDVGSTFLGFTFAILGFVLASRPTPVPFAVSILAISPFLLDGTFTILRRLTRGEAIWKAHRSHLYQRAVTSGLSHREVLRVYAVWIAAAATCALEIVGASTACVAAAVGAMIAALIAVWGWVVMRERRSH